MNYLLGILLIVIVVDIYIRFKTLSFQNYVVNFLAATIMSHEKTLLLNKVISGDDLRQTRKVAEDDLGVGEKNLAKLKTYIAFKDPAAIEALSIMYQEVSDKVKNNKFKAEILELIYRKEYQRLNLLMKKISESDNVK